MFYIPAKLLNCLLKNRKSKVKRILVFLLILQFLLISLPSIIYAQTWNNAKTSTGDKIVISSEENPDSSNNMDSIYKLERNDGVVAEVKRTISGILTSQDTSLEANIKTEIIAPSGEKQRFEEKEIDNNSVQVLIPQDEVSPGKYTLKVQYEDEIYEKEFLLGVLTVNINKSVYRPGEEAYIQMAALKDDGHTLCDANLMLAITSPSGKTEKPAVYKSGECSGDNVTDKPDYFANYQVEEEGRYSMELTNIGNGYSVSDYFEARSDLSFDVERTGPTRIFPPADYEVKLKIKAKEDFKGKITETVPLGFDIISEEAVQNANQKERLKEIIWQVDWEKDKTYELEYTFNAPNISPYIYFLGPLKIEGSASFEEIRQWQIASDIDTGFKTAGSITNTSWSTCSAGALAGDDTSYCTDSDLGTAEVILYNFNFSVPANAQSIDGIEVQLIGFEEHALCDMYTETSVSWDGSTYSSVETSPDSGEYNTSDDLYTEGGPTSTWGHSWSVAEVNNNTNFKVKVVAYNAKSGKSVNLDQILVKVYYNVAPIFTAVPAENPVSSTTSPTTLGNDVTFEATATDSADLWKLLVCKENSVTPSATDPTCGGSGQWCRDGTFRSSASQSTCSYTTTSNDTGSNAWYAFACDDNSSDPQCSSMSQGSGDSGSPFVVSTPVSGYVYDTDEVSDSSACDGVTENVKIVVNGTTAYTTTCNGTTGEYQKSTVQTTSNDIVTVYIDGAVGGEKATTVTRADGNAITGVNLFEDRLALRYETGSSIANSDLEGCDNNSGAACNDSDILFESSSNTLTMDSGKELHIYASMNYAPGGTVSSNNIHNLGTITAGSNSFSNITGYFLNAGTFTSSGSTLTFNGAASQTFTTNGSTFDNITINNTGSDGATDDIIISGNLDINGTFNLTNGDLNLDDNNPNVNTASTVTIGSSAFVTKGAGTWTFDGTTTYTDSSAGGPQNIGLIAVGGTSTTLASSMNADKAAVTGTLNLASSGYTLTLAGSGTGVSRPLYMNGGTLNEGTNSTIKFTGTGNSEIEDETYYNLILSPSAAGSPTYSLGTAVSQTINVSNDLSIGDGTNIISVDAETYDPVVSVSNNFSINTNSDYSASTSENLNIGGDFTNDGTFTSNDGAVVFNGSTDIDLDSGCADESNCPNQDFYNLAIDKGGSSYSVNLLNNNLRVNNTLTITTGILSQGAYNIRAGGATAVSIDTNGTWSNLSTGDISLDGSLTNSGTLTFKANDSCGGTNDIAITAVSGTPSWSGGGSFEIRDVSIANQNAAVSINTYSSTNAGGNTGTWYFYPGCDNGALATDIVDTGGNPVSSPVVAMATKPFDFDYQGSTGVLGVSDEKMRVSNTTANSQWTLSIAATSGPTAYWDGGTASYDYNDPSANATDGSDDDSLGGQMSVDPSSVAITPQGGCNTTGLSQGISASFNEETALNSITILSSDATTEVGCYWDLTGTAIDQSIPQEQSASSYSIDMTLSVVAY